MLRLSNFAISTDKTLKALAVQACAKSKESSSALLLSLYTLSNMQSKFYPEFSNVKMSTHLSSTREPHGDHLQVRKPLLVPKERGADLWRPIETALDVGVCCFCLDACRPKIDDFDVGGMLLLEQDVLWLKVAMDDAEVV
jgi:hypothetical protein